MSINGSTSAILGIYNPRKNTPPVPSWGDTSRPWKSIPKPKQLIVKDTDGIWKPVDQIPGFQRPGTIVGEYIVSGEYQDTDIKDANIVVTFPTESIEARVVHDILRILYSIQQSKDSQGTIYPELFEHIKEHQSESGFKIMEFHNGIFPEDSVEILLKHLREKIRNMNIRGMDSFIPQIGGMLRRIEK